jgi:hypothetical protein
MRTNAEGIQLQEARAVVNEVLSCGAFMLTYRDGVWIPQPQGRYGLTVTSAHPGSVHPDGANGRRVISAKHVRILFHQRSVYMSRTNIRRRIVETAARVPCELHWQTWSEVHPSAADLAISKVNAIVREEMKKIRLVSRLRLGSHSSAEERSIAHG